MDRRYYQMKFKPEIHRHIKLRAKQVEVSMGEFLENLVSSLELRLEEAYKVAEIQEGLVDELMLRVLIKQEFSMKKEELLRRLDEEKKSTTTTKDVTTTNTEFFKTSITV